MPAYKRILLKLSGEALMGDDAYGINRATIVRIVREVQDVTRAGCEVAVVIGGGNIFRGVAGGSVGMDRATADYMGMLATVMNALALADTMRQEGMTARVMSAIAIEQVHDNSAHRVDIHLNRFARCHSACRDGRRKRPGTDAVLLADGKLQRFTTTKRQPRRHR